MIHKILTSGLQIKETVKNLLNYINRSKGAKKSWKKRHSVVFAKHPDFKRTAGETKESAHRNYYSAFSSNYRPDTYRICEAISGDANPKTVPEEIFQADIEPSLNRMPEAHYLANKSLYNRWYPDGIFPLDYLHSVGGELLNGRYEPLSYSELDETADRLPYPVILKPNLNSFGGSDIHFIDSKRELLSKIEGRRNFVVQEKVQQHDIQQRLHPSSLNTVRVYLYKSVLDNTTHIINIAQRVGNGGPLDNVASGGLVSFVLKDGRMHGYALDRYGEKYLKHPVTNLPFTSALPEFETLKKLAVEIASKLFCLRVVGLDLCYDQEGNWRVIEVNTKGHSIRFAQYAGHPFFGEFTDEVIEYCRENHWALTV